MNIVSSIINILGFTAKRIIAPLFGFSGKWSEVIEPTITDIGKIGFSSAKSSSLIWLMDLQNVNIGIERRRFANATSLMGRITRKLVNLRPEITRRVGYILLIAVEALIIAFVTMFSAHAWEALALLVYFSVLTSAGIWISPVFAKHTYQYALKRNRLRNRALRGDQY